MFVSIVSKFSALKVSYVSKITICKNCFLKNRKKKLKNNNTRIKSKILYFAGIYIT